MRTPGLTIRPERPEDTPAVYDLNEQAFGQSAEANLVDALRDAGKAVVSFVSVLDGRIVGHPEYYPRFGFAPASRFGLRSEYDVPDEVFMALELRDGGLTGCSGIVAYEPEFARV